MMKNEKEWMDEEFDATQKIKSRTIWAFGAIGFLVDFFFAVNVSASQDILEATKISTTFVLLAISAPASLATVTYPYLFQRIAVSVACCVIFTLSVTGILITSLVDDPRVKLIGVSLVSFGSGFTEAVFYPLTSLYGGITVNSYAFGSGLSFIVAPLSYAGKKPFSSICLEWEVPY